jgi:hypothetical protein
MCGHLLNEKGFGGGTKKEDLDLGAGDDLRAAAEAALRELGRGSQKADDRPEAPDTPLASQEKSPPAKPKSAVKKPISVPTRGGREKTIVIASGLITLIALISIMLGTFRPWGGGLPPYLMASQPRSRYLPPLQQRYKVGKTLIVMALKSRLWNPWKRHRRQTPSQASRLHH